MTPHAPRPLPEPLRARPFTVETALEEGETPRRLRARDLDARVHGVRAARPTDASLRETCALFATRLTPEAFFSHSTAARLLGAPIPRRLERMTRLHVTVAAPHRAPHARGLIGHSRQLSPGDVAGTPDGLRQSSPERLFCEMGGILGLGDLVALADFLIHHRSPLTDIERLARRVEVGDRIARSPRLRAALSLAHPRAESRPESLVRVILERAGFSGLSINHEVVVGSPHGPVRYRIDIAIPERMIAIEYLGDHHRDVEQWRRDRTRRLDLEAANWTVVELGADDIRNPQELVARVCRILARSL